VIYYPPDVAAPSSLLRAFAPRLMAAGVRVGCFSARVGSLERYEQDNGKRHRRLPFWKPSPALPDRIAGRSPVEEILR
jgi:hypothetical protein